MQTNKLKRVAGSIVASAVMVGGLAVAAPTTAFAVPDRYDGPTLTAAQSAEEKNVTLTLTNPNKAGGAFSESACTSTLLDGEQGLQAFVAYNNKDFVKLLKIVTQQGLRVGPSASNDLVRPGPNSNSRALKVDDGVYLYVGTCGGINSLLPGNVGVSIKPVIVPDGIGSLSPAWGFGSLMFESGSALMGLGSTGSTGSADGTGS